jgi:starch synthase (maltosyl-transferring)
MAKTTGRKTPPRRTTLPSVPAAAPDQAVAVPPGSAVEPSSAFTAAKIDPLHLRRVVVEHLQPEVDGGRFPAKRIAGDEVTVRADVHADGHDQVTAVLLHRRQGDEGWQESPMEPAGNDRFAAAFTVDQLGRYEYTVEGWIDRFGTWRHEISKKFGAGQEIGSELLEGAELVRHAAGRNEQLLQWAATLGDAALPEERRVVIALDADLHAAMAARPDRTRATRYDRVLEIVVERERARFGAWYEMFPRSAGSDPSRSATFREAAARLSYVAGMGFDVLYLPPIHPIGRSFRKGKNNTLDAGADDVGSPWAIGGEAGGHKAVEPGLGTLDDFDWFVGQAKAHGLEIALDLAYQASPDHPYVKEHPQWFRQRPDGTIKYAENPPKKYQDIYPINFESAAWQDLWPELKSVIEFWIDHGVTIFRVDNPHTKPFRFWQWALGEITRKHPEAIFLSEAFTRPKVMRYLAKSGFSQSYTYFTWRNTRTELTEYFTELTQTDVREYMRPNLFANTPDILHEYLQHGGRPAFEIRFVLAATLGASYGIYSGYELAENLPVKPGSEEYLDSEKYQIRVRNFDVPHTLAELIGQVNQIRRTHPALQHDWSLRFHPTDNEQLICYSKRSVDGTDLLLMVVTLDPHNMQHGFVQLPLTDWGVTTDDTIEVVDVLSNERYFWRGEWNYVRLDPQTRPAHILAVQLPAPLPPDTTEPIRS